MTPVDVVFHYATPPGEREMRALDRLWEVYGIRRVQFDERAQTIRIEYDATRLNEALVASLLRKAGIGLRASNSASPASSVGGPTPGSGAAV